MTTSNGQNLMKNMEYAVMYEPTYKNKSQIKDTFKPFDICSPNFSNIFKAFIEAKKNFQIIGKTATNPMFKSKHATLDVVYAAIQPALLEQGLFINCSVVDSNLENVITKSKIKIGGQEKEVDLEQIVRNFRVVIVHAESGEYIGSEVPFYVNPTDPQKTGISFTYLQRYIVASLLSLVIEDDDDGNAASGINPYVMTISEAQANYIKSFVKNKTNPNGSVEIDDLKKLLAKFNASVVVDLAKDKYDDFLKEFEKLIKPVEKNDELPRKNDEKVVIKSESINKETADNLRKLKEEELWDVNKVKEVLTEFGVKPTKFDNIPTDKYEAILAKLKTLNNTKLIIED